MTTMDFEALSVANIGYKDRVDERDRELEKLRIKYICLGTSPPPIDNLSISDAMSNGRA